MLHRRHLLAGATALAASPLTGWHCAVAQPAHRISFGAFEIAVLTDGTFPLPISFLLPDRDIREIEALLVARGTSLDALPAQTNAIVVKTGSNLLLIDTGGGTRFFNSLGNLATNLEQAGFAPDAFTHVVFTHGHPDHLWGAIDDFDEPRFAKAAHLISATEHDHWRDPETANRASEAFKGLAAGSRRMLGLLDSVITRLPADGAILPGITAIPTPGHTPGHVSILIESGGERLLVGGDILGHPVFSFERPDWRWGSDADADAGIATRRRILDMLATDRIRLAGYHLPWPGLGRVERSGTGYRFLIG